MTSYVPLFENNHDEGVSDIYLLVMTLGARRMWMQCPNLGTRRAYMIHMSLLYNKGIEKDPKKRKQLVQLVHK